jgi:hypothetical protein
MKRVRWILVFVVLAVLLAVGWLIWARPRDVDMAAYAPAKALLYMETNEPLSVVQAIVRTDAWKLFDKTGGADWDIGQKSWTRWFVRITGIGPIQSVILSRAQIAIVVTELGAIEEEATLRVRPEAALIIETHTSETRIRTAVEQAIKDLAQATYDKPALRRTLVNGVEFVEWRSQEGSRQIVAAIVGSLVVIGNSEAAVQQVLDSAGQRSPSLKDDANLERLRREFSGKQSLTFGYVPQEKSARLISFAVPLILGRAPGDAGFQKVVSTGATKLFGSIAWGSRPFQSGIEDRYLISLQPSLLRQLEPALSQVASVNANSRPLPENTYSVTYYRFEDPALAWESLKTSVSSNVDALSAVVFSSLMKSALLSYGINEPEAFLRSVKGEILTLRLDRDGEHRMFIAGIRDREALRGLIAESMKIQRQSPEEAELFADAGGEMAASLLDDVVILGTLADVRRYSENNKKNATTDEEEVRRMTLFAPLSNSNPIVTYTDDSDRVRRFLSAIMAASGTPAEELVSLEQALAKLPYAATETRLIDQGLERTTRSPLGQFSTFLPLLVPDERRPQNPTSTPR